MISFDKALLDRIKASLLGVRIGDALGMPWELYTRDQIMSATGGIGVIAFGSPLQRRIPDTENLKVGETTDDTQLSDVVARSLIMRDGWNTRHCAWEHVLEYNRTKFGWGGTTTDAIKEIKDGKRDLDMWRPWTQGKGLGNGVAMKVAPLALFDSVRCGMVDPRSLASRCMDLGRITHPDLRASFAAYAVALVVGRAMSQLTFSLEDGKNLLEFVIRETELLEIRWEHFQEHDDKISGRLKRISGALSSAEKVRKEIGSGFNSMETAPFTIATFLRHPNDFRAGVLEAINAGGDTDTHASIVGAMVGANVGLAGIPEEWRNFRPEYADALRLGEELFFVAKRAAQR